MEKNKLLYESPQLTVVEFKVEHGFAGSFTAVQSINMFIDREKTGLGLKDGDDNFVGGYMDGPAEDNSDPIGNWSLTNGDGYF